MSSLISRRATQAFGSAAKIATRTPETFNPNSMRLGLPFWLQQRNAHIVLRGEVKGEKRRALAPDGVKELIEGGNSVSVVRSRGSAIKSSAYKAVGAKLVSGNFVTNPKNLISKKGKQTIVLGVKELENKIAIAGVNGEPVTHMFFAHMYKDQQSAPGKLATFIDNKTQVIDLEYLVDELGKRVSAFSKDAGYCSTAIGLLQWCRKELGLNVERAVKPSSNEAKFRSDLKKMLEKSKT